MFLSLHLEHFGNKNNLFFILIGYLYFCFPFNHFDYWTINFFETTQGSNCVNAIQSHIHFSFVVFSSIVYRIKIIKTYCSNPFTLNQSHAYNIRKHTEEQVMLQTHVCGFFFFFLKLLSRINTIAVKNIQQAVKQKWATSSLRQRSVMEGRKKWTPNKTM